MDPHRYCLGLDHAAEGIRKPALTAESFLRAAGGSSVRTIFQLELMCEESDPEVAAEIDASQWPSPPQFVTPTTL